MPTSEGVSPWASVKGKWVGPVSAAGWVRFYSVVALGQPPRVCSSACWSGSSPRLWGTHVGISLALVLSRFIPTPVGNTRRPGARLKMFPVHPHACGEHTCLTGLNIRKSGSSPRLWGTLIVMSSALIGGRFIPTPVGNTSPAASSYSPWPVHPHACGEHLMSSN